MVQKGKILGKPTLVFLTIGTTQFQFNRLLHAVDNALVKLDRNYKLIAQVGNSSYRWSYKKLKIFNYLSPSNIITCLRNADYIFTHGGTNTLHLIVKHSDHLPFVVARIKKFNEHVSDHQEKYLEFIKNKIPTSIHKYISDSDKTNKGVFDYLQIKPKANTLKEYLYKNTQKNKIIVGLTEYLDKLEN